mmetsp:Transcript_5840/g.13821  ORF Transcript_5840/g.13821 Transcript_5840/m.13821 type:complete len:505 (-) Transcript_5840:92-1606(-)|eukprot:CAMPEP_0171102824 /NCGR_PEP_ID=MMETSP0766_2-20121228/58575_1 /TAXON_ID=439317 /ORGANISM="Gambierdiscus australes, Strain CAWD 149" /LENGTH=504 /DNA_ID=CAMNT_0011563185 /DNA_START=41 /DNA_END=1555 /DNA_ORIENTATION=+
MARVLWCVCLALSPVAAVPDDAIAMVQRLVDVPALSRHTEDTGLVKPTQEEMVQAEGMINLVTSKGVDKVLENLNLTKVPPFFKWQIIGALTKWALDLYSVPKPPAKLDALNGIIELYSQAFLGPLGNEKVIEELLDWDKIHAIVRRFAVQNGATVKTLRAIDAAGLVVGGKHGLLTGNEVQRLIRRAAGHFRGHPLADTFFFVTSNPPKIDQEGLFTHLERLARHYELPPVVVTFLRLEASDVREKKHFSPRAFSARLWHSLALAADQLLMPIPVAEAFDFVGNLFERKGPAEVAPTISKLYDIAARISSELGGSDALTELLTKVSNGVGGTFGAAPAMVELQHFWERALKSGRPDAAEHVRILGRLADQLGMHSAVGQMERDLAALGDNATNSTELFKHAAEALGKIGLPNISELLKSFAPAAGAFATVLPHLLTLGSLPGLWKARDELKAVRDSLRAPVADMYDHAVALLSHSKSSLVRRFATAEAARLTRVRSGEVRAHL